MNKPANNSSAARQQEELREEIEHTRERLGETVEALGHKADIPARTKEKANDVVARLPEPVRERGERVVTIARQRPVPFFAGVLAALLVLRRLLRRRRDR